MNTNTILLVVIIILLVFLIGGLGVFLVWRWLNGILNRLARLEAIANTAPQWEIPYKLRAAILDAKSPLIEARISLEAEMKGQIARLERALELYSDIYYGNYDPNQKAKKK